MEKRLENLVRTKQYNDLAATDKRYADQFVEDAQGFELLKKMAQANIGVTSTSKTNAMRKKELDSLFDKKYVSNRKIWRKNSSIYLPIIWGAAACFILVLVKSTLFKAPEIAKNEQVKKIDSTLNENKLDNKTATIVTNPTPEELKPQKPVQITSIKKNAKDERINVKESIFTRNDQNTTTTLNDEFKSNTVSVVPEISSAFAEVSTPTNSYSTDDSSILELSLTNDKNVISKKSNAENLGLISASKKKTNLKKTKRLTKVNVNDGLYYLEVAY
jgi:hypothetical protein